jgi:hypothetical protein
LLLAAFARKYPAAAPARAQCALQLNRSVAALLISWIDFYQTPHLKNSWLEHRATRPKPSGAKDRIDARRRFHLKELELARLAGYIALAASRSAAAPSLTGRNMAPQLRIPIAVSNLTPLPSIEIPQS